MFSLHLEEKDILMRLTVFKEITKKDIAINFLDNIWNCSRKEIANKINLILTKDILYLEYKGHAEIGYAEETRKIEEIYLSDLTEILVKTNEHEELVEINTAKKKFAFTRDNSKKDNLGLSMRKLIYDIKKK